MNQSNEWKSLDTQTKNIIEKYQAELPIKLGKISSDFGLIVKRATLPANISGEIKEVGGNILIRVNRHDAETRQRYTLAHEIAHFLLHKHLLQTGITDDVLYRSNQSDEVEAEANRLAADILMPVNMVQYLVKYYESLKGELLYETLADCFNVSITAIKIRLNKI
jgi:hypothetical protein